MLPVHSQCAPVGRQGVPSVPQWASSVFPVCSSTNYSNQESTWRRLARLGEARTATRAGAAMALIKCQGFNCNGINWCGFRRHGFNCSGFNATASSAEALIATPPGSSEAQGLRSPSLRCSSPCSPFPATSQHRGLQLPGCFSILSSQAGKRSRGERGCATSPAVTNPPAAPRHPRPPR